MKNVAVVLSGCGFKDGSEITEAVSALIALSEQKANYSIFGVKINFKATDHLSGAAEQTRDSLIEAARIARGKIQDVIRLKAENFDAVVFPGGFGAATLLCSFAKKGSQCDVHPEIERVINEFYNAGKPIGAICIAPALVARVLGKKGITVTIGDDGPTAKEISKTGAHHERCAVSDFVTDREHRVITTPAYMYDDAKPNEVFMGIRGAIKELVEMA